VNRKEPTEDREKREERKGEMNKREGISITILDTIERTVERKTNQNICHSRARTKSFFLQLVDHQMR